MSFKRVRLIETCTLPLTRYYYPGSFYVSLGNLVASANNILKGVLEGGTSNKEAIDVRPANEISSIFICDASTVQNTGLLGSICRHI